MGGLAWRNTRTGEETSSIGVEVETSDIQGWARLHYTFTAGRNEGQKIDYKVPLVTIRPYFGGVRWWFICLLSVDGYYCGRQELEEPAKQGSFDLGVAVPGKEHDRTYQPR